MWKRDRFFLVSAAIGLVMATVPVAAQASLRAVSDDTLARSSAAAVQGRVVATSARWDDAAATIYTFVTIDVVKSWGFPQPPPRVVVKQLGGVVGDTAFVVGGQAQFEIGEDVVVFLDVRPRDNTLSVAGLEQGKWVLTGSADLATSAARDVRGKDPAAVVAREYGSSLELDQLAALAGTRVSADEAVVEPKLPAATSGSFDAAASASYTLLSSTAARWHQADTATPVYVDSQSGGHPQFAGGGLTQLWNAAALWRAAGSLPLQSGVERSARCFSNTENDSRLSVTYGDPCGEISDASSTLAVGGAYYSSIDQRVVNGVTYWKIVKGMIVTDNPPSKFSGFTTGCYEEMLVHEIGHAIGFGHAAARPAIMYPSISSACLSRAASAPLGADDRAGMAALYPSGDAPPPPPPPPPPPTGGAPGTPTDTLASVVGSTVTIRWNAATSGGAATSFQVIVGTAPGAANLGSVPVGGTALVVPGVPAGVYYARVVAINASGVSVPTAQVAVTVGVTAPAAPASLWGTAPSPGVVSLSWAAPSAGATPTSYVVVAGHSPGASTFQVPVVGRSFTATGVPPGTYYVRVVALNGATPGAASSEVTLIVR